MAPPLHSKRRSSFALRSLLLLCGCAVFRLWGPAFNVKGSWDGELADMRGFPQGLQTNIEGSLDLKDSGAKVMMDDGHLNLRWARGPVSLHMDDTTAWQANVTEENLRLLARGRGLDDIEWEASKQNAVEGLGDVRIDLNSDRDFGLSVAPSIPDVAGVQLRGVASSSGEGIQARLEAQRALSKNWDASYRVENQEGDYDLANLAHAANLVGKHGDGTVALQVGSHGDEQRFNATYMHNLERAIGGGKVLVGADNEGIYGTFAKSGRVAKEIAADYEFAGRSDIAGTAPQFAHAVKLSHDLGTLKVRQNGAEELEALLESEVRRGPNRLRGKVGYSTAEEEPRFNVSYSRDFEDALANLGVRGTAQIGLDDSTEDGIYGRIDARRKIGKDVGLRYSSAGRPNDMQHIVELSNDLGYAQLVKHGDSAPRLRMGYEFDA